jgi:hypothetical protein
LALRAGSFAAVAKDSAMISTRPLAKLRRFSLVGERWRVVPLIVVLAASLAGAQNPPVPKTAEPAAPTSNITNQTAPMPTKSAGPKPTGLEKTRDDAAELSTLADQIRDELKTSNVNVLSFDVLQKTEAIEKLARKIKGEANEH